MNKMVKIAVVLVALASVFSFADGDKDKGGFKLGFEGSIGDVGSIGLLFNLGNGLEAGLGIAYYTFSQEITEETSTPPATKEEHSLSTWAIAPSVAYQLGKKDLVSYGAGLQFMLSSWSKTDPATPPATGTTTTKPDGMDMAFIPNFYIKVEPVKNFVLGLRTGISIYLPADDVYEIPGSYKKTTKSSEINTATSVFIAFYL